MYKINRHHQMKPKSQIKTEFFFNDYKVSNDFFEKDIFMRLPQVKKEFKIKNEKEACKSNKVICIRKSEQLSSYYTLPSIFIRKEDNNKCKTIINNFLKNEFYNKLPKRLENRVVDILDELKLRKIKIEKFRKLVIDFVLNIDENSKCKYDHKKTMVMLEDLDKEEILPVKLINIYYEKYSKISIQKKQTEKEKTIILEKRKLKERRLKKEKKEKEKIETEKNKIIEFNENKKEYIDNSFIDFVEKNNDYYDLFNNNAKQTLKKYFKVSFDLIIKNEDLLKDKSVLEDHVKLFLFLNEEQQNFLKNNSYILSILNCEHLQFEYNHIIESLKEEIQEKYEKHEIEYYNFSRKKKISLSNGIKLLFNIKLDKQSHELKDFEEINAYTERSNIGELFHESIKKESIIKDDVYIRNLYNEKIATMSIFTIYLNDIKTFKENINKFIEGSIIGKLIKPNSSENMKKYEVSTSKTLKVYKDIFQKARNRKREIIYYAGKTNSGKTYQAFEELKKYNSGVYLAPLRLLAVEGQEEIEKRGMECSLLTGEERNIKQNANFTSSTIEMLNTQKEYDVAIIDEIQMINDTHRGAAWLQALVGVNAKKIIIVGSSEVRQLIFNLADYLNEPLIYKEFERKTPLKIIPHIKENRKLDKYSAVIAFSKKELFKLKEKYERLGNKVSIIYGKLPPEVKIKESEKFRTGKNDVLISTDAIGMGLNLPIKKVYFNEIEKYNGFYVSLLEPSLVKQIAGRAGRFGKFETGCVSSFSKSNNDYLKKCLDKDTKIENPNFSTKINLPIFNELLKINKKRDIKDIVKLSNHVSFDITNISYINLYSEIAEMINKCVDNLSNNEIVSLLNAPLNEDRNNIYVRAFKTIFKTLMKNKNKTLEDEDFEVLYDKILNNIDFNTKEKEYKLLDLLHFFTFNFKEFSNFEKRIKDYKTDISIGIMSDLAKNINEDDLRYYYTY